MIRRRSTPWIHKWSRPLIATIAGCGALVTGYLTIVKLTGGSAACTAEAATGGGAAGCNDVLASAWGTVFGQPLALFGFLAYFGMLVFALAPLVIKTGENKKQRQKLEGLTWFFLLVGAIAMTVFSSYLMFVLFTQIQAVCPYCIASALFSLSMLVLTIVGRSWEDLGQIFFTAIIVGMVTLVATLAVYNGVGAQVANPGDGGANPTVTLRPSGQPKPPKGWEVTTTSGEAEVQLAKHLKEIGAKKYSAWWCPHCYEQKQLFGKEAVNELNIIECAPQGNNPQPELCQSVGIKGFPTWEINNKLYPNVQSLEKLAELSGYKGPRSFKNFTNAFQ